MSAQQLEQIEQLQATLSKMQVTLNAIAEAVVWVDENQGVQWCNASFELLVNQPDSTILDSRLNNLLPLARAGQPLAPQFYPDVLLHQGEYKTTEYEFGEGDRSLMLQISGSCTGEAPGKSAVLVIREITQAKDDITLTQSTQASLPESEEQLRTLINATPDIISFKDGEGRWLESNPATLELLELQGVDYRGKTDAELAEFSHFYRDALLGCHITDEEAWQKGSVHRQEEIIPRPDGTVSVVDMIKVPLFYPDGRRKGLVILGRDISDKKRVEEALQASEARLNTILSRTLAAIERARVYANRDWQYEYISPSSVAIWGYCAEEIMGDNNRIPSRIYPEDWAVMSQRCFDAVFAERPFNYEYRYNHPDGSLHWISVTVTSVRDEVADCWIATAISTDISDKKRVEAALSESEAKFRTIVENANAVLAITNVEGILSYVSPNVTNLTGWTPAELEGQSFAPYIHPDDLPKCLEVINRHLAGELAVEFQYRVRHKDGSWRWQICNSSVSRDANGQLLFITVTRDITDHKLAEEALKASEARLNTILNSTLAVIYCMRAYANRELNYEYCSAGSLELWGYSPEQLIADKNSLLSRIVPEDLETTLQQGFNTIYAEGTGQVEYRYNHPDGNLRWISSDLTSVRDEATDSWFVTVISMDITDRKLAEEALKVSEARLNTILNSALAAIYRVRVYANREWNYEYCSAGSVQLWGYSPEQLIADKNSFLWRIAHEDLETTLQQGFNAIFTEGTCEREYRYNHPDGTLRWISFNLSSVRDEATDSWIATIISTDITERKRKDYSATFPGISSTKT